MGERWKKEDYLITPLFESLMNWQKYLTSSKDPSSDSAFERASLRSSFDRNRIL